MMNCATLGLEAYVPSEEAPWNVGRVQHLYRRAGFGARPDDIVQALTDGPAATVNRLLETAITRESRPDPVWADWDYDDFTANEVDVFESFISIYLDWIDDAIAYGVREKLSLFWQNHLVAIYESHSCPTYQVEYLKLIDQYGFGDYREFVKEMTKTPAMLFFLNGFENTKNNPNENYARELFELFTLGENNGYTQEDIVEASRALTGWNGWTSYCGGVEWADWGFDDSDKTVFGRTGNFNYSTLIDVLFEERGQLIARFICGKLYNYYVNTATNEDVVEAMAQTFIANNFQIAPVLRELFSSAHFFEAVNVGVLIKSPMELMVSFLRQGDFGDFQDRRGWGLWAVANMGQYVGHPTDVAGWAGDRAWIDSNRLTLRWDFIDGFSWAVHNADPTTYPNFARLLTSDSNSPEVIARTIVDYFVPRGLVSEMAYETAIGVLKWDIPSNYYDTGEWNLYWDTASWQITLLLRHIGRMPEAQLN
ncbi:DUF1800 domain-containing protein [Neolewinella aurantiaca]|uniref:DUF1800 domain-containing protein n=1 Tax=Neolewinella aurantiaca TaxID=2602767 RepID=A0A5C7FHM6_9BACT|nr:DUF1800 domain-containing protein [Neolewinella aurantiaca]TXF89978.1 DUF1800 domain-containing protein [Neolewinella aurantiaca]